jgi:glycine/D-amino acid oxidase-like deaminating enzyme
MNSQQDVAIIGGGVIGVCCASYLAQKGIQVTLIEKGEIASGCSYGNGGLIVPSHCVPLASPGALAATPTATSTRGIYYFDAFETRRQTYNGP